MKIQLSGFSFFSLFLVFLVLKLTGIIGWSWRWITAPLWGPTAVMLSIVGLALCIAGAVFGIAKLARAARK